MAHRIARFLYTILAIALLSQNLARAQEQRTVTVPFANPVNNWDYASNRAPSKTKLLVITTTQPKRRNLCRVRSFGTDRLVCESHFGETRSYKPQEIAALILPGDSGLQTRLWIGLNAAAGVAAWGTYVLAPVCIPCAVATGVVALFLVGAAGAIAYGDDQPERLLYLAPSQKISPDPKGRTIRLKSLPSGR